jgi:hypothetical protein
MDRRQLILVVFVVLAIGGALWLRDFFSPGQAVRRQLFEAAAAFENERILGVMPKISRSYTDRWGGSYESLGGQIQSVMDAADDLDVELDIDSVDVGDNEVRLEVRFVISGTADGTRGALLGTSTRPCRATIRWLKEQPGWRLVETEQLDIPELRDELDARENP